MPSRSRDRQLAKLAERRRAEKEAARHRKKTIVGTVLGLVLAIAIGVAGVKYLAGSGTNSAGPTHSSSASPSTSPSASPVPFKQTGTVNAQPPPKQVACGAKVPAQAGTAKPQYSTEPPMQIDTTKTYTATFKTSCGTIVIQLDGKSAPHTVNSFVFLAQHHFFDGLYFTRLDTSIAVIQGGDPTGTGSGGPGYSIPDELHGGETYDTGVFAMAKTSAPNSGGSQFFIISGPAGAGLNASPNYTVFGRIISGLAVAQKIQALPITNPGAPAGTPGAQLPKKTVYMESVTITVT
jgi:cyclophilin family peptidyl-prolyl cis-trans isomerase